MKKIYQIFTSSRNLFVLAIVARIGFLIYGEYQDNTMVVKYTDIDYVVFSDASKFVQQGLSPYERSTYRYTPLLAYLMLPNNYFPSFGKILFSILDILIGFILKSLLNNTISKTQKSNINLYLTIFLLNPMVINVSTRGNAESIITFLVVLTLYFIHSNQIILSAICFGLSVHFKIYPIIYGLPLFFFIGFKDFNNLSKKNNKKSKKYINLFSYFTKNSLKFFFISSFIFLILFSYFYYKYGWIFFYETYFYHVIRKDNRHNFSVYFYHLYLHSESMYGKFIEISVSFLSFLPQILIISIFGYYYFKKINYCLFLQTLAFVTFNKVCTVQYFIWYISLIPLALPYVSISFKRGIFLCILWFIGQGIWLGNAYALEFLGKNFFLPLWISGIIFFFINIFVLLSFISNPKLNVKQKNRIKKK